MTREEAIQILADLIDSPFLHTWEKQNKALHMAIEALSADAVSREELNDVKFVAIKGDKVEEAYRSGWNGAIECIIENAPSAEAVQGEWIGEWIHEGQNFKGGLDWCHCSVCGQKTSTNGLSMYRYCPNCGARMKGGGE